MSKWLERQERDQGRHGTKSERKVAKSLGARLQPGSGAVHGHKSDAKLKGLSYSFRIECKSTVNMSMKLEMDWLTKISTESLSDHSIPTLVISFVDEQGRCRMEKNAEWVAMPRWAFDELREAAES